MTTSVFSGGLDGVTVTGHQVIEALSSVVAELNNTFMDSPITFYQHNLRDSRNYESYFGRDDRACVPDERCSIGIESKNEYYNLSIVVQLTSDLISMIEPSQGYTFVAILYTSPPREINWGKPIKKSIDPNKSAAVDQFITSIASKLREKLKQSVDRARQIEEKWRIRSLEEISNCFPKDKSNCFPKDKLI